MLGVQRHLDDCCKRAADLGWPVAGEYVDINFSGDRGRPRPQYKQMLSDLTDGAPDELLTHVDMLTRRAIELEQFLNMVLLCHQHHHDHHDRGMDLEHRDGRQLTATGWGNDPPGPA